MIFIGATLKVLDSGGVYFVKIFRVLNSKYEFGKVGKFIICSTKIVSSKKKNKKT
jgi:ribosomal protein L14